MYSHQRFEESLKGFYRFQGLHPLVNGIFLSNALTLGRGGARSQMDAERGGYLPTSWCDAGREVVI